MYSLRSRNVALKDVSALSQVSRDLNRGRKRRHISLEYETGELKPSEQTEQGDGDPSVGHGVRETVKAVKCESAGGEIKQPLSADSFTVKVETVDTRSGCDGRLSSSNDDTCPALSVANLLPAAPLEMPRAIVKQEPVSSGIALRVPPSVTGEPRMKQALVERTSVIVKQEPVSSRIAPHAPSFVTGNPCVNLPQTLPYPSQPFVKVEPCDSISHAHVPGNVHVPGEPFAHGMTFPQGFAFTDELFVKPEPGVAYFPTPFQAEHIFNSAVGLKTEAAASIVDESSSKKSKPGASRKKALKTEDQSGETEVWEPPLWREQLANIVKMREKRDAPVDIEGAHKNAASLELVTPEVCVCTREPLCQ